MGLTRPRNGLTTDMIIRTGAAGLALLLTSLVSHPAQAAVTVSITEVVDVGRVSTLISYEGELDLTGTVDTRNLVTSFSNFLGPDEGLFISIGEELESAEPLRLYDATSTTASFGTGDYVSSGIVTGDQFYINFDDPYFKASTIGVSLGYQSGDPILGSVLFEGLSFDDLGLFLGTYTLRLPNDTVVLSIGNPVPLPSAALLFAPLAFGSIAARRRAGQR